MSDKIEELPSITAFNLCRVYSRKECGRLKLGGEKVLPHKMQHLLSNPVEIYDNALPIPQGAADLF